MHSQSTESLSIAAVCPMANEQDSAVRFVREALAELGRYPFRKIQFIAILDNACTDNTRELLQELSEKESALKVVFAPENRGVVDAYQRGYREGLAVEADCILEIDAGYSHLPKELSRFIDCMQQQGADCVFATRFAKGGRFIGGLSRRYLVSRIGSVLSRILLGVRLTDMTSGYQLFTRKALQEILRQPLRSQGPFFQTEMKYRSRNLRCFEVPITYTPTAQNIRRAALADALRVLLSLSLQRISGGGRAGDRE